MKFTREDAIKALEGKIPAKDKGLDLARTISEAVDNSIELVGEESEMELADFVEKVWKQVKTSIGLTHSENSKVAQSLQNQIAELQKQLDKKKKKTTNDEEEEENRNEENDLLTTLRNELDEIKGELKKAKDEQTVAQKRSALIAKMGESIKDKEWIESYLSEITITEGTDVEAKAKDYIAFYNKTHTKGGKVTPMTTDTDTDEDSNVKSVIAAAANIRKSMSSRRGVTETKTETK